MHGDPQHGGSVKSISVGDIELTSIDHEAQEAQEVDQPERKDDAQAHGLRQQEDGRGRNGDPASGGNTGDDTGWGRGDDGSLLRSADSNGGEGLHGRVQHAEPTQMQLFGGGEEPARDQVDLNQIHVFMIPVEALPKALQLGAGLDIEKVIMATDDETVAKVQDDLVQGRKHFWAATQGGEFIGCLISGAKQTATGVILDLPYMAGKNPQEWLPLMTDLIEPLAREAGYEAVETHTREGMRKFLISLGWRKTSIRMRRDFNGKQN